MLIMLPASTRKRKSQNKPDPIALPKVPPILSTEMKATKALAKIAPMLFATPEHAPRITSACQKPRFQEKITGQKQNATITARKTMDTGWARIWLTVEGSSFTPTFGDVNPKTTTPPATTAMHAASTRDSGSLR